MTELSARLQQLHDAGTPGDWAVNSETGGGEFGDYTVYGIKDVASASWCPDSASSFAYCEGMDEADAELIVALRNNAPEIIAALEAVERVRELHVPVDECPEWGHAATPHNCPTQLTLCESDAEEWPCPTIRALDGE